MVPPVYCPECEVEIEAFRLPPHLQESVPRGRPIVLRNHCVGCLTLVVVDITLSLNTEEVLEYSIELVR